MRDELTERIGQQELLFLSALFFLSVPSRVFESGRNPANKDDQTEDKWQIRTFYLFSVALVCLVVEARIRSQASQPFSLALRIAKGSTTSKTVSKSLQLDLRGIPAH